MPPWWTGWKKMRERKAEKKKEEKEDEEVEVEKGQRKMREQNFCISIISIKTYNIFTVF